jgi:hypothetical protein
LSLNAIPTFPLPLNPVFLEAHILEVRMAGDKLKKLKKPMVQEIVQELENEMNATNEGEFQEKCALQIEVEMLRRLSN